MTLFPKVRENPHSGKLKKSSHGNEAIFPSLGIDPYLVDMSTSSQIAFDAYAVLITIFTGQSVICTAIM
ncbi:MULTISPECIES: hypothetical protein [unclassified Paraburkholderia]|uniref:hypothetical protein n=1 Tax=unclassified Paraburkholderia TaxID=2615204 RepID=UPI002AB7EB5D|nr:MULTISPECIES: hypothetical protein [unclassified Paraburkholderia]